jgi:flagellar protein FlaG
VDRLHEELDMSLDVARIEPITSGTAPERAPRDARGASYGAARDAADMSSSEIPSSPPADVLDAVDAAARTVRELHAQGRELHFVPASESDDGHMRIEVRDLDGNVLRTIPPGQALDVATGHPLD